MPCCCEDCQPELMEEGRDGAGGIGWRLTAIEKYRRDLLAELKQVETEGTRLLARMQLAEARR